jgi:hypothetical protein
MLAFAGTLNLDDRIVLREYQLKYSKRGVNRNIAVIGAVFCGAAFFICVVGGYSEALWFPALILFSFSVTRLPVFQASVVKREFKKYPPVQHAIEIYEDKIIIRNVNQTSDSSWAAIKYVWKTKQGYIFFSNYDQVWFFLPQRLFLNAETERKLTALMTGADVKVINKA